MAILKYLITLRHNGVRDWLLQRFSAVVLMLYMLYLGAYIVLHPGLDYLQWHLLFASIAMRIVSFFIALSFMIHAWIGLWTISTDYLKCPYVRLGFQIGVAVLLLVYLLWSLILFWTL